METSKASISRSSILWLKIFTCCIILSLAVQTTWAQEKGQPKQEKKKKAKLPPEDLSGQLLASAQYNFNPSDLKNVSLSNPTSLQFGPDGRLYVSQQNGIIKAFTVVRSAANDYSVTATESISLINGIPNHNDDGTPNTNVKTRQVTGILLTGTAAQPVLYVGSSDSRIGGGSTKGDIGLDTNSGIISRLTKTAAGWVKVDLVRGLPRSEENHSVNGMQLDEQTNMLYLAVGGSTNAGSPSNNFAFTNEYALSAAILSIDLNAIDALPTIGSGNTAYKYNLPTLDDPTRPNNPDGTDPNDPFGGNDGLNQARIVAGGPVRIFSPGYRNAYDLVITKTPGKEGRMYTSDNGANQGWGGHPDNEGANGSVTNSYVNGEPGSTGPGPNDPKVNNLDNLHYIGNLATYLPGSHYAGHPTPTRANPSGAGLYTHDGSTGVWRTGTTGANPLPSDWPPVPLNRANPIEGDFQNAGETDLAILTFTNSTNGLVEYTASNFSNSLQGALLAADYGGYIHKITFTEDGTDVTNTKSATNKLNGDLPFASGFGSNPLDVTAQGDAAIFPGSVWAATYGANAITIFEPNDFFECSGTYSTTLDDDNDCHSNADEIDNGTNPCSASSKPMDSDRDCLSDLNDPDDDNDGLGDNLDYFPLDAENGLTTALPLQYDLFNNDPGTGFFGLGFTGLMSNKQPDNDYINHFDEANLIAGGAVGAFSIVEVSAGDALGALNNQENAFQFGVHVNAGTGPFTFHGGLLGPFFDNQSPQNYQSQGIYMGTGDQDNYLKIVLNANGGAGGIEVVVENAGQPTHYQYALNGGIPASSLELYLAVNPAESTVQPKYVRDGGLEVSVGSPILVSGELLTALQGSPALALGIIATSRGASPFTATWDILAITADPITATGTWETVIPDSGAPTARHENAFVQAGEKFYLVGGRGIKAVQEYDPVNKAWTNKAATPMEIHHFQAVTLDGLIYVVGAFTGGYPYETPVPNVYIYNPLTDKWIIGPTLPEGRHRGSAGVAVYNKKIYLVSGIIDGHNAGHVPWMDEYDPATNNWRTLPDAPRARDHFQAAVINNKLYLAGGRRSSYATGQTFSITVPEVDVYDFATSAWSTLPAGSNIPTQRAGTSTAVLGEELLVIGGESASQSGAHKETEALNVGTNKWRRLADLNVGRHGTQPIVNNNSIYIVAGSGSRGGSPELSSMEAYYMFTPTTPTGTALVQSQLTAPGEIIFASVEDNLPSTKVLAVTNSGTNQAIVISSIEVTGSSGFSPKAPYPRPFVLAAGQTVEISITYDPAASAEKTAELVINHSGLNGSTVVALREASNSVTVTPESLHFFSQEAGTTSQPQEVVLTNNEATELEISSVAITGANSAEFSLSFTGPVVLNAGASTLFSVYFTPASLGTKVADLGITHTGNNSPVSVGLTGEGVDNPESSVRINAGGSQLTAFGATFDADKAFSGGTVYSNSKITDIAGTTEDALYKSERYGSFSYNFPLPSGTYRVRLHFAEIFFGATGGGAGGVGKRVFNVTGEGQALLTNFDIYAEAGAMAALVKEFSISVTDGTLNLFFSKVVDNAKISAIEIISNTGPINKPPVANAGPDQTVTANSTGLASVQLNGSGSTDAEGAISAYRWTEGGSELANGATPTISLAVGTHTITLTVTDDQGATGTDQVAVTVNSSTMENQPPVVANPIPDQSTTAGVGYTFTFIETTFSDPEGDDLTYTAALSGGGSLPAWLNFNGPARTFSGTPGSADLGTVEIMVTASDGALSASDLFNLTVASEGSTAVRINSGGGALTAFGTTFAADGSFSGGKTYTNTKITDIAGTTEDALYKSERYGSFSYNVKVPAGTYLLRLHFAEIYFGATGGKAGGAGKRVFNVSGEGQPLLTNFDIYATAGSMTALVREFEVSVTDGTLNLLFSKVVDNPKVSAIEILPTSVVTTNTRINAGGAQLAALGATFEADQAFSGGTAFTNTQITDIAGTTADALYRSERYGSFSYNVKVPSGGYLLRLHFAEIFFGATGGRAGGAGSRVFHVTGEGQPLLTDFDIYAAAGSMTALVREFEVSVADGTLNLAFVAKVNNPKVSAIEVLSLSDPSFRIDLSDSGTETLPGADSQMAVPETGTSAEPGSVVSVYPNPFEDIIQVRFQAEEPQEYTISLYDVSGRLHYQSRVTTQPKERSIHPIDLSRKSLKTGGVYLLFIESNRGNFLKIFKMVKK